MDIKHKIISLAIAVTLSLMPAQPAFSSCAERILFPIALGSNIELPGAYGTVWTGDIWYENKNDRALRVEYCPYSSDYCNYMEPGIIDRFESPFRTHPELGLLIEAFPTDYVLRGDEAAHLTFSNRIYETTRHAQPRGIEIPVVRESEFLRGEQSLLGIPAGSDVRIALRVYDPWIHHADPPSPIACRPAALLDHVVVEIVDSVQKPVASTTLKPVLHFPTTAAQDWFRPGFAAINDLASVFPQINAHDRIHVRLRPVPADAEYWAMITVTDNDTQTLSVITAQ